MMALLPTYQTIGIISCYLIALIRIMQGISVGGEYSGAIIYTIEHFDKKNTGLVGAIVVSGCLFGVMLARIVSTFLQTPNLPSYGWRFAFLLGFLLSMIGFFIRKKLTETPDFLKSVSSGERKTKYPLIEGVKTHYKAILSAIFIVGSNGVNLYFAAVFLPEFLKKDYGLDVGYLSLLTTIIPAFMAPLVGHLSDKWDRGNLLAIGLGAILGYCLFVLPFIFSVQSLTTFAWIIIGYALLFSIQSGTLNTFVVEIFPTKYRFSCGALSYALGMAIIGGTSPMIATILTSLTESNFYIGAYMILVNLLSFISILFLMRNRRVYIQSQK